MRPKYYDIDPIDVDTDGIAESQTPAAGGEQELTLNGALCDLGTAGAFDLYDAGYSSGIAGVRIGITSAADETARTFTVTGTDQNGHAVTETITGANAGVAESTKYFRTISSVAVDDDTAGAITVGPVDEVITKTIPLNYRAHEAYTVAANNLSGTIQYDIQETFDDVLNNETADFTDVQTDKTTEVSGLLTLHATATRLVVDSYTSGAELQFVVIGR